MPSASNWTDHLMSWPPSSRVCWHETPLGRSLPVAQSTAAPLIGNPAPRTVELLATRATICSTARGDVAGQSEPVGAQPMSQPLRTTDCTVAMPSGAAAVLAVEFTSDTKNCGGCGVG